jgi:hypothetical protein
MIVVDDLVLYEQERMCINIQLYLSYMRYGAVMKLHLLTVRPHVIVPHKVTHAYIHINVD